MWGAAPPLWGSMNGRSCAFQEKRRKQAQDEEDAIKKALQLSVDESPVRRPRRPPLLISTHMPRRRVKSIAS